MKQDLREHFEKLAAKHRVRVFSYVHDVGEPYHPLNSVSVRRNREIYVAKSRGDGGYAVALHELGHVVGPYQKTSNSILEQEAGAWKWAKENALRWSPTMERAMHVGMLTYFEHAWHSGHSLPHPFHFFWKCLPKNVRTFILPRETALRKIKVRTYR